MSYEGMTTSESNEVRQHLQACLSRIKERPLRKQTVALIGAQNRQIRNRVTRLVCEIASNQTLLLCHRLHLASESFEIVMQQKMKG